MGRRLPFLPPSPFLPPGPFPLTWSLSRPLLTAHHAPAALHPPIPGPAPPTPLPAPSAQPSPARQPRPSPLRFAKILTCFKLIRGADDRIVNLGPGAQLCKRCTLKNLDGWAPASGILFLGMLHSLKQYLNPDVKVIYPRQRVR